MASEHSQFRVNVDKNIINIKDIKPGSVDKVCWIDLELAGQIIAELARCKYCTWM